MTSDFIQLFCAHDQMHAQTRYNLHHKLYYWQQQRTADCCVHCNYAGEDAFTLQNAALFIDDYLGAYPNGICLSSFVSCPKLLRLLGTGWLVSDSIT